MCDRETGYLGLHCSIVVSLEISAVNVSIVNCSDGFRCIFISHIRHIRTHTRTLCVCVCVCDEVK